MRRFRYWLVRIFIVFTLFLFAFTVYLHNIAAEAQAEALIWLQSSPQVSVGNTPYLTFNPKNKEPKTGFIFYPGGLVKPEAYAPPLHEIAAAGFLVVLVPMPFNLAFLGNNRAEQVIERYPNIEKWVIGGHSLGGAMASRFVKQNPMAIQGLVLWAAYPAESDNLSTFNIAVTSIYGTQDGLLSLEELKQSHFYLPPKTNFIAIEGGNHAQFAWYGPQNGDQPATISHIMQQRLVVSATLSLLEAVFLTPETKFP